MRNYSSKHAFEGHDTHSEIVDLYVVVLPAHDLGGYKKISYKDLTHVARGPGSVLRVLRSPLPRDSEICDAQVTVLVEN